MFPDTFSPVANRVEWAGIKDASVFMDQLCWNVPAG